MDIRFSFWRNGFHSQVGYPIEFWISINPKRQPNGYPSLFLDIHLDIHHSFWISKNLKWISITLFGYPSFFLDVHHSFWISKILFLDIHLDIHKIQKRYPEFKISFLDFMDIHRIHRYPHVSTEIQSSDFLWIKMSDTLDLYGFHGYPKLSLWTEWISKVVSLDSMDCLET